MKLPFGFRRAVAICAVATIFSICVAGAGADSSTSFPDRVGDAGSDIDITGLDVESAYGFLTLRVNVAGTYDWDQGDGGAIVALDIDQNPDTGSAFYGTELEFVFQGSLFDSHAALYRANGWDFQPVSPAVWLQWGMAPHFLEFTASLSDLGIAPNAGFNVVAVVPSAHTDTAPDRGTFNFQQVPGTPPPPIGPDTRAPHVSAFPSRATHGKVAKLAYWSLDGRGRTAETVRVYRGSRLLKTIHVPLSDSNPFVTGRVTWRVPSKLRGRLQYSVRSVDAAGNRSTLSWARIVVR